MELEINATKSYKNYINTWIEFFPSGFLPFPLFFQSGKALLVNPAFQKFLINLLFLQGEAYSKLHIPT